MRIRAQTGISFYRIGEFGGIEGPTFSKWLKPRGHPHHRNPTEEQVLEVAVSLAYNASPPGWIRNLYEADDETFIQRLDQRRLDNGLSWPEVGERSTVGTNRVAELIGDGVPVPRAVRLRLLIATVFDAEQVELTNRLLQAAGKYVLRVPETAKRRSA